MKVITFAIALFIGVNCFSQNITYNDLITIDWSDYPLSAVEMLLDKEFNYLEKQKIDASFELEKQTRESLYTLIYARREPMSGAFVAVDEENDNNMPDYPVMKLHYPYVSKSAFTELSNEIKSKCGKQDYEFYFSPDSLAFIFESNLNDGEPTYSILIYHLTKEEFKEAKRAINEMLKEMEID